jgi:PKD repeat protein
MRLGRAFCLTVLVLHATHVGCGKPAPKFGEVSGKVVVNGKPMSRLYVQFLPDPDQGNDVAANASGETDEQGNYTLRYVYQGSEGNGAVVGWNRIIVEDTRLASVPQGAKLPPLVIPASYSNVARTPLSFEVKPGAQTFDIQIPQ